MRGAVWAQPAGAAKLSGMKAYRASILRFDAQGQAQFDTDGGLLIGPGPQGHQVVLDVGDWGQVSAQWQGLPEWEFHDLRGHLIAPGFVDMHIHYPQTDVIGAPAAGLLPWLENYTFPHESRFADGEYAASVAEFFLDELLRNGVTTALTFATSHPQSADALFAAAQARGLRLITGKVLQDRHSPDGVRDQTEQSLIDTEALIRRWHGVDRLGYAITPRFAPTSSEAQLRGAGELAERYSDVWVQSHVAENHDEVRWVAELFPQARSYLDVYAQHGLVGPRSIFAHGIWLDDADRAVLREAGAQVAFCPGSNLFLGSGLFDWHRARAAGVAVSLASDVGGGTGLSMRRAMLDAYQVQAGLGQRVTAWALLHAATRGAAAALHLQAEIGSLEAGAAADVCVWDRATHPLAHRRQAVARDLHDGLFAWVASADERDLVETWVAGTRQYVRGS